ncbi:MAG: hypothetical protein ABOK23_00300 [Candidatus Methanoperedens sp.]|nr:hypothetical protein [Candidatus Methanoperedens sp.]MCZ7395773.1 hypothetical protein [Candidatus Methanoperedens sp.]
MVTKTKLLIGLIVIMLTLGIGLSLSQKQQDVKPSWVHQVQWQDKPGEAAKIEELLWAEITPYRTEYETVNISASTASEGLRLKVMATAKDADKPDIYDFVYDGKELLLTGYLLEAIPFQYRNEVIGIALGNQEVAASAATGTPTVRRILPKTSEKFYAPKTLLSVTWGGVSALIDPDEQKVVQVWKAGAQQGDKPGGIK